MMGSICKAPLLAKNARNGAPSGLVWRGGYTSHEKRDEGHPRASYTYDSAGHRTSKANYLNGVTSNYSYDPLYELTQVTQASSTTESYSYDAVGNRLSSLGVPSYQYNTSNELTASSLGNYSYDANGNTLTDAQGRSFTWDFENRLTQVVNPGVGTTTFRYDPFGRRIQKSGPLGTTNYFYDGDNLLEEADNSGSVLAGYTQGSDLDEEMSEVRSEVVSYYEEDALGSNTSLSNSAGALANTYTYNSFGNLAASMGTLTNPFEYTGREFDSETGLYYYRTRYYDQTSGRFLGEDIQGFGGGFDFYSYVRNDPNDLTDPFGECPKPKCFAQLKYRYARNTQNYAFWWVQDSNGKHWVVDGGPTWQVGLTHLAGYLNHWKLPGDVGHYPKDNPSATTAYTSGLSEAVCNQVDKLLSAADSWPDNTIPYDPFGPNSNSFAHSVGNSGGFTPQQPPNTVGWNTPIPTH